MVLPSDPGGVSLRTETSLMSTSPLPLRVVALLSCLAGLPAGAWAADPVYPPGSRFGFEPAKEMVVSRRFTGFEREGGGATVSVVELPAQAYKDLTTNFTDENLKSQGLVVKTRETLKLADGREGLLVTGEQPIEQPAGAPALHKWVFLVSDPTVTGIVIGQTLPTAETDEAMRAMLTSVRVRPALTLDQQVAALPFRSSTPRASARCGCSAATRCSTPRGRRTR